MIIAWACLNVTFSRVLKPSITAKRLQEIEGIQDRLRPPAKEYKSDFTEPNALDAVIDKDLQAALVLLELLKGFYKSKTDEKV